jgi:hypothetical protein
MSDKDQEQSTSDSSTAYQAGRDINITGLSYSEVRQVALDVFKDNFYKLSGEAGVIAQQRAEEITENILNRLIQEFPDGFDKAKDPEFQYSLFTVQREYARSGEKNLGQLLVDLLIKKSKLHTRDFNSIVLNEALTTAPKLTQYQQATLSVIFFFKTYLTIRGSWLGMPYTYPNDFSDMIEGKNEYSMFPSNETPVNFEEVLDNENILSLTETINLYLKPHADDLGYYWSWENDIRHLHYSGCISNSIRKQKFNLASVIASAFDQEFKLCIPDSTISQIKLDDETLVQKFFTRCNEPTNSHEFIPKNPKILKNIFQENNVSEEDKEKIHELFYRRDYIKESLILSRFLEKYPSIQNVMHAWSALELEDYLLTPVGEAIALANIHRYIKSQEQLTRFINIKRRMHG